MIQRPPLTLSLLILATATAAGVWLARRPAVALASETDGPLAPELSGGLGWINTDHPLRLADLRGQVVLLDFWTYG